MFSPFGKHFHGAATGLWDGWRPDAFGPKPLDVDSGEFGRQPNMHFLDGSIVELDGLKIAGLSGIVGNPGRPFRRHEFDYVDAVGKLCQARLDILILHDGPDFPEFGF
jgi:hypothetical protein